MDIKIGNRRLSGIINAASSKAEAHRYLIAAALSDSYTKVYMNNYCEDIMATLESLFALGYDITTSGSYCLVGKRDADFEPNVILNCRESGATSRFLLPYASLVSNSVRLRCGGTLMARPFSALCDAMRQNGVSFHGLTAIGHPHAGTYTLDGDVSSQFVTGLMFMLPLLESSSEIVLTSPLQSLSYAKMTQSVLEQFGIVIKETPRGYHIEGNQRYKPVEEVTVGGDWSNSAFWLAANLFGSDIILGCLDNKSMQGDRRINDYLRRLTQGYGTLDCSDNPDLVPILAVAATRFAKNEVNIVNIQRLRYKESNRIKSVVENLRAIGGNIEETDDGLLIRASRLTGGVCDSFNDHRIVMAFAIAALICSEPVIIKGAQAVIKSYPNFFDEFILMGGDVRVI